MQWFSFYIVFNMFCKDFHTQKIYKEQMAMADPGWGIWGKFAPPPCGGAILLIKILNFVKQRSAYKVHENMYILLQIT